MTLRAVHRWFAAAATIFLVAWPLLADAQTKTNLPTSTATNAEPHFTVRQFDVIGNTLLPTKTLEAILVKRTGTNVSFDDILAALKDLQMEYHNRGYDTVKVTIPQQRLTNDIFKVRVFEGKLVEILVKGNRHTSSNYVRRMLPSLRTNMLLNSKVFQAELDRANANADRQIYPEIHPGPLPDTSSLWLVVEDRSPLHAKLEANNQSSPGTPEQRLNTSVVYNNLWQENHSMGLQYSFSEEYFKKADYWNIYDKPAVANYSGFYRLPLAEPGSLAEEVSAKPTAFGYDEATRKFRLPPASEAPELNIYASRSTIDSGVATGNKNRLATFASGTIDQETDHQDLTINEALGLRYSQPLPPFLNITSHAQAGVDFKTYRISSFETNNFIFTQFLFDTSGNPFTQVNTVPSPVPGSTKSLDYFPLTLQWDGHRSDKTGSIDLGFHFNPNLWHSGSRMDVDNVAGSKRATGHWRILGATLERDQTIYKEWKLSVRADGQWSSEPLIPIEQFGVGGIAGVRGYREGEVFGDSGWRITSEFKTPSHRIGYAGIGTSLPLTVRASVFMDYAQADLIDPRGRKAITPLWGTGIGGAANLGNRLEAHLGFSWPLLSTPTSEAMHLRVTFALAAQF